MLKLQRLVDSAIRPKRNNPTDAGLDLFSVDYAILHPGKSTLIGTGWAMSVPTGYEIQIRSRSGLAAKNNIIVLNAPGTIDSSYTGHIKVILFNAGEEIFEVKRGDRVAQMVINKIELWQPTVVESLDESDRGNNGFGSSGV